ncbi:Zinc-regulated transporter 2-like protein 1 [Phlyctema vagabunda]|uniref:Zinc-regulated transporter 2-like protein 1 n=1 Tax=Phlyctema vagabunda TaxID=108571 RepID=A0ABR4P1Q7_9HELO
MMIRKRVSSVACGASGTSEEYDLPFHITAVFIILAVSSTACAFPLIVIKAPRLRIPPNFLFGVRHFGTGVLLATAFVHLLPTAFISLTDPCLPSFWNEKYPAMAGALALAAVFLIAIVEMVFSPGKNSCAFPVAMVDQSVGRNPAADRPINETDPSADGKDVQSSEGEEHPRANNLGLLHGRTSSTGRELQRVTGDNSNLDALVRNAAHSHGDLAAVPKEALSILSEQALTEAQRHQRALLQCLLLEMGILFHSVFIGMALSVAVGNDFVVLLIAISFHQTFEGLALGSRIAALTWKPHAYQPWIMAIAYGCTTPIGQAIGLATHTLYDPGSEVGLLMVGIMNAISSGLLTFTSLVDLMSEDFLSDESWRILRGRKRVVACLLVFGGAFSMSLIGAWA